MTPTMWSNDITGERLDADELARLRAKAHVLYEANVHIFEDELDALAALGAVPVVESRRLTVAPRCRAPSRCGPD